MTVYLGGRVNFHAITTYDWNLGVYSSKFPGVNFINVLHTAFTLVDPESVKKIDNLTVFFMLLGSPSIKAVRRMLMKSTPGSYNFYHSI